MRWSAGGGGKKAGLSGVMVIRRWGLSDEGVVRRWDSQKVGSVKLQGQ